MTTPRLNITVIPSNSLVKSHYIHSGQFLGRFLTSMIIDTADFQELTPQMRSLILNLFLSNDDNLSYSCSIELFVDQKQDMITSKSIVNALIAQLQLANSNEEEGARQQREVDLSIWQDGEDPPF